ncbi:hypothetical protein [Haloplanus litoreus]|uniref:Uncharacterized protein n=1 Tax=Haloplanus litoreus TaxID=767515 RepID=A0ABD5ZTA3_9EURY
MTDSDGRPLFEPVHLVDAAIVAAIVFFSLLLGDAVPAILTGQGAYVSPADIYQRLPTAAIAFGLVLCSQWARYRGIQLREALLEEPRRLRRFDDLPAAVRDGAASVDASTS